MSRLHGWNTMVFGIAFTKMDVNYDALHTALADKGLENLPAAGIGFEEWCDEYISNLGGSGVAALICDELLDNDFAECFGGSDCVFIDTELTHPQCDPYVIGIGAQLMFPWDCDSVGTIWGYSESLSREAIEHDVEEAFSPLLRHPCKCQTYYMSFVYDD